MFGSGTKMRLTQLKADHTKYNHLNPTLQPIQNDEIEAHDSVEKHQQVLIDIKT